jgi:hypothetical protein
VGKQLYRMPTICRYKRWMRAAYPPYITEMQVGLGQITTPEHILIYTALQSSEGLSPQQPTPNIDTPLSLISTF